MAGRYLGGKVKNIEKNGISIDTPEGQMQVNTSESGNISWPKDMPSDVPEFKAGKIEGTTKLDKIWTIVLSNVNESDISSYKNALEDKGWKIEGEVDAGIAKSYTATKNNYQLSLSFSPGEKSAVLGVNLDVSASQK